MDLSVANVTVAVAAAPSEKAADWGVSVDVLGNAKPSFPLAVSTWLMTALAGIPGPENGAALPPHAVR